MQPPWTTLPPVCSYIPLPHGEQLRVLQRPYAPSHCTDPSPPANPRAPFRTRLTRLVCPVCCAAACPVHGVPAVRRADEGAAHAVRRDDGARHLVRGRACSPACWRLLARPVTPLSDERVRTTWPGTDARSFARAIVLFIARDPRRRGEFATPAVFCLLARALRGHSCADCAQYYYHCKERHITPWEQIPSPETIPSLIMDHDHQNNDEDYDERDGEETDVPEELPNAPSVPPRLAHAQIRSDLNALELFIPCVHNGPCTAVCV